MKITLLSLLALLSLGQLVFVLNSVRQYLSMERLPGKVVGVEAPPAGVASRGGNSVDYSLVQYTDDTGDEAQVRIPTLHLGRQPGETVVLSRRGQGEPFYFSYPHLWRNAAMGVGFFAALALLLAGAVYTTAGALSPS
jgi:hypothetical protein